MDPNSKTGPQGTEVSEPDLDKKGFEHHEKNLENLTAEEDGGNAALDRKITRKIDLRLLPLLVLAYTMTFLDRVNIGNARLWNMEDDLGMKGYDFNIVVLVFYIPFIIFEVPSNMVISRVKPRYWLSGLVLGFGLTVTFAGFCTNFAGLLTARIWVGIFEAGMFPGCVFLISAWYTRQQVGARIAWFLVANDIAGSISGLLGAGLGSLDGTGGYSGWSWIFFLEGAATCVVGIICFFTILPFPKQAKLLPAEEKERHLQRLAIDDQHYEGADKVQLKGALKTLLNWKLLVISATYMCVCTTSYSITVFQPTILKTFGWSSLKSNLLSAPVRIVSGIVSVSVAHYSNHVNRRAPFIVLGFSISILGLFFTMLSHDYKLRYAGLYLGAIGIYIAQPLVIAWGVSHFVGKTKRGTLTAFATACGQIGGIISAVIFPSNDGPYYVPGVSVCISLAALGIALTVIMGGILYKENSDRAAGKRDHLRELPREEVAKLGEHHPDFRYTI